MADVDTKLAMSLDDLIAEKKAAAPRGASPARAATATRGATNDRGEEVITVARRVYVSNLSYRTTWQELKDHFRQVGAVVHSNVMSRDGRSKGCGIVEFERPEDAASAILKLHDSMLGGRPLCVREDREDRDLVGVLPDRADRPDRGGRAGGRGGGGGGGRDRTRSRERAPAAPAAPPSDAAIFVGNLPFTTSAETLRAFCASVGEVLRADVPANAAGKSRGYGIVEFANPAVAAAAVSALHDRELEGRKMLVRMDRGALRK